MSPKDTHMLEKIQGLIDRIVTPSPPSLSPPSRPRPARPKPTKKEREETKQTINMLLLRAHVVLTYTSEEGLPQALRYTDRARDHAVAQQLPEHRAKAQWYRGETLMRMERWGDAYEALVASARAVAGGWRAHDELKDKMDVCWKAREREKRRVKEEALRRKSCVKGNKKGKRRSLIKAARFNL